MYVDKFYRVGFHFGMNLIYFEISKKSYISEQRGLII
jgi:hypothetical protein